MQIVVIVQIYVNIVFPDSGIVYLKKQKHLLGFLPWIKI